MPLNLNALLDSVAPWDFSVAWDGRTYATARPTIGQIAALQGAGSADMGRLADVVAPIFAEPRPDLSQWPIEAVFAVVAAYSQAFGAAAVKNSPAIAAAATAAVASSTPAA